MMQLNIEIAPVAEAPHYKARPLEGFMAQEAEIIKAVIVPQGTEGGRATVDFQFRIKDRNGTVVGTGVAMLTGRLVLGLAQAIVAVDDATAGSPWAEPAAPHEP